MNGLELKKIRKDLGMTQTEMAKKVSVTLRTIQNYEKEATEIPNSTAVLIRGFLGSQSHDIKEETTILETLKNEISLKNEMISFYKEQSEYYERRLKESIVEKNTFDELTRKIELIQLSIIKLSIGKKINTVEDLISETEKETTK